MIDANVTRKTQKVEEQELISEPTPSPLRTDSCSLDDLLCIPHHASLVLSLLSIRELLLLGCASRQMRVIHQDAEISRRRHMWCQSASRYLPLETWETYLDVTDSELSDGSLESTDDPTSTEADSELSDDSLESTDDSTSTEAAHLETLQKESDYYNILAKWCGGWPRLLHAREAGAPLPPIGPPLSTPYEDDVVLLWDIRCEGVWKWSGTLPLDRNQPGNVQEISTFPVWQKTVGDGIKHILWSGCASDHRSWEFSVSLLSSTCSETLLHSHTIVPSHLVETIEATDGFRPTTIDLRLGDMEPEDGVTFSIISPKRDVVGITDEGSICSFYQRFKFHVFSDKRQPGVRRIHLMWAHECLNTLFSKMIANPPPRESARLPIFG